MEKLLLFLTAIILQTIPVWSQSAGVFYSYNNDMESDEEWMEVSGFSDDVEDIVISSSVTYEGRALPVLYITASGVQGKAMKSITIPASIESCSYDFTYNTALEKVIVPNLTSWCDIYFNQKEYNPLFTAHHLYSDKETEITDLQIPYDVKYVGSWAFAGCTAIETLVFYSPVTNMGGGAFMGCSNLSRVVASKDNPFNLYSSVFAGISPDAILVVPVGTKALYQTASWESSFSKIVEAGTSATIGDYTYAINAAGTGASVKANTTSVTALDFLSNVAIDGIAFPVIEIKSFSNCTALREVVVPNHITYIGKQAFFGCTGITSVSIEDSDKPLVLNSNKYSDGSGGGLFESANNLTSAYIGRNLTLETNYTTNRQWECAPFYSSSGSNLSAVTFGSEVTYICDYLLYGCSKLTSVTVRRAEPAGITTSAIPNRSNATLYVPAGSKTTYATTDVWKDFKKIIETGDANGDGSITITDAVAIVNKILGNESADFNFNAADVNGDGEITITDAVGVVNIILGGNVPGAPTMEAPTGMMEVE